MYIRAMLNIEVLQLSTIKQSHFKEPQK
uniref:Uncharacterized protein n=1 Tax=Rhizophora mucronata TaxID=61149 RepID=A0A2P2R3G5_RHIMU